jgi:glutathione S-transferase
MELLYTPRSPYVRKVRVALIELGLQDRVKFNQMDLEHPAPELSANNPLGKVPTLILDDGQAMFDSSLICEYLDSLGEGPKLFPSSGAARWTALRRQTLANGILDAVTTRRHEARRPDAERSAVAMEKQKVKSDRGLAALEKEVANLDGAVTIGEITIACCLGYLDFRFANEPWRPGCPGLAKWYDAFSKRRSMVETTPPPGGH